MRTHQGLVYSNDEQVIETCQKLGYQIEMEMVIRQSVASFLLELQNEHYTVAIFDCGAHENDCVNWIRLIRRQRPKTPLIVFCDDVNSTIGAKMYQEGIFYLGLRPIEPPEFLEVLKATVKQTSVF